MRRVIGSRLALGVRICGDELIDRGTTIDEAVEISRLVEATGQVDYVNTSIGVATASLFMIEASMHIPPGYALFIPSAIRKAVELPVSVDFLGRPFSEPVLIRIAAAYERATRHRKPPKAFMQLPVGTSQVGAAQ